MVYIVMGVSGCGKTTIGKMLAEKLEIDFFDSDDYHSQESINKMKRSIPLEDKDRIPWLLGLAKRITQWNKEKGAVLACSALKEKYRQILSGGGMEKTVFIYLKADKNTILKRIEERKRHFFPIGLLESQFKALEEPRNAIIVGIDKTPQKICAAIIDKLINRQVILPVDLETLQKRSIQ